jgi:hypothetical protein
MRRWCPAVLLGCVVVLSILVGAVECAVASASLGPLLLRCLGGYHRRSAQMDARARVCAPEPGHVRFLPARPCPGELGGHPMSMFTPSIIDFILC